VKDPALAKKAARLLDLSDPNAIRLQRLDGQVWRASTIEGSADCTNDGFFRVKPDGSLTAVRTPPSFAELCFTSGRSLGLAGRPALIETDSLAHPDLGLDVEVTPWDGRWETTSSPSIPGVMRTILWRAMWSSGSQAH
jgi:hypothetical protein